MPGGRPKGSRNKTPAFQRKIAEDGDTPLDYLLKIVRDDTQERGERIKAAIAAAPYVHPRLSQIEQTVTHTRGLRERSDAELSALLEEGDSAGDTHEAASEEQPPTLQ